MNQRKSQPHQVFKPPIWEWFMQTIYGDLGDGLLLLYPHHYTQVCINNHYLYIYMCVLIDYETLLPMIAFDVIQAT